MAFDFPSSPKTGQQFTPVAGTTYQWNGYAWDLVTQGSLLASGAVQRAYAENNAWIGGAAYAMAGGLDTVPQQTDGLEVLSVSITPKVIGNTLRVSITVPITATNPVGAWLALFQDSVSAALASTYNYISGAGFNEIMTLTFELPVATLSPTTFKARIGQLSGGAPFLYINGGSTQRYLGGSVRSTITITEYSPLISPSPTFTGGNVLLATRVASNSAQIDFAGLLDSTYDEYEVVFFGVRPATNNDTLSVRISEAGVFQTGASYVNESVFASSTAAGAYNNNGASAFFLTYPSILPNTLYTTSGKFRIFQPSAIGIQKNCMWESLSWGNTGGTAVPLQGGGWWNADGNAIDGLRFYCGLGNTTMGTFKLYGVR